MNCIHDKDLLENCDLCGAIATAATDGRLVMIPMTDLDGVVADLMAVNSAAFVRDLVMEKARVVPIERRPVESSNLASVGFDGTFNVLEVEFKTGDIYRYFGVPIDVGLGLIDAESKGKYFHANIIQGGFKFECMFKANKDVPQSLDTANDIG